ncbi:DUF3596 domain-containing protein [Vibrio sp. SCSIO 43136]|uniref:tyrosine-type recombinase/integrase n=1 Tax=Vibrio sp. SCSIO 43136 TaxID=2819101 RepID=UPI002074AFE3|nr:DUF3596 domain-containing protein [Vibrio sp. SCSIO 43136]USD68096.1 site-specific integrase [Vibrio sp. SCSIO 43136]
MAPRTAPLTKEDYPKGVVPHGNSIRISFTYNGERKRETLGIPQTKQNVRFAELKLQTIKYEIEMGTFNYAAHFPNSKHASGKPIALTMKHLSEKYLKDLEHDVRRSTFKRYSWVIRDFLEIYGENRRCDTISPRSLVSYRNELVKGRSGRTINRNIVTVKAFIKWLFEMEYIDRDHSHILKRVKESEPDINPFSMEEFETVLRASHQLQHRNLLTLLAYSGLRSGEACALAWEDIDFENRTMHIRRSTYEDRGLKTTKTDKERFVDMLEPVVEALKAQRHLTYFFEPKVYDIELPDKGVRKDKIRFVFNPKVVRKQKGSEFDYYGKRGLSRIWKNLTDRVDVEHRCQYQLRHTYASWMITHANVNVSYLAQQMGHSDITMVAKIYGKWLKESNKKESDRAWGELEKVRKESSVQLRVVN